MAISSGAALVFEGAFTTKKLKPLLEKSLAGIAKFNPTLSIEQRDGVTLVAPYRDDAAWWFHEAEHFMTAAAACAKALKVRVWCIAGHVGSSTKYDVAAFDAKGNARWRDTAVKKVAKELGVSPTFFELDVKPFLGVRVTWKSMGTVSLSENVASEVAESADAQTRLVGLSKYAPQCIARDGVTSFFSKLGSEPEADAALEALGLRESAGWKPPEWWPEEGRIGLPGKKSGTAGRALSGLVSTRENDANVFRWGHLVHDNDDVRWLRVLVARSDDASWAESYVAYAVDANDGRAVTAALALSDARVAAALLKKAEARGLTDSVEALRAAIPKKKK